MTTMLWQHIAVLCVVATVATALDRGVSCRRHIELGDFTAADVAPMAMRACQCAQASTTELPDPPRKRFAVASILHTNGERYACGAVASAAQARRHLNTSEVDLVMLLTPATVHLRADMERAGWRVREVPLVRSPLADELRPKYNQHNWSKFAYWTLVEYDAVLAIDTDVLIFNNVSWVFAIDGFAAYRETENDAETSDSYYNSGIMVVPPSLCAYAHFLGNYSLDVQAVFRRAKYAGDPASPGDQMFLNAFLRVFGVPVVPLDGGSRGVVRHRGRVQRRPAVVSGDALVEPLVASPAPASPVVSERRSRVLNPLNFPLYTHETERGVKLNDDFTLDFVHFFGVKPWNCPVRTSDCNDRRFNSPGLYRGFWRLFADFPEESQELCIKYGAPRE